jgi:hypothetical protein
LSGGKAAAPGPVDGDGRKHFDEDPRNWFWLRTEWKNLENSTPNPKEKGEGVNP